MQTNCAVFRTGEVLAEGSKLIHEVFDGIADVARHRPLADLELRPDRDAGIRQSDRAGRRHHGLRRQPHRKPRRARPRGFPRARRPELDEAHAGLARPATGKVTIDYRPVHTYTMTNDVPISSPRSGCTDRRSDADGSDCLGSVGRSSSRKTERSCAESGTFRSRTRSYRFCAKRCKIVKTTGLPARMPLQR